MTSHRFDKTTFFPPQNFSCELHKIGCQCRTFHFCRTKTDGETRFSSSVARLYDHAPLWDGQHFSGVGAADNKRKKHIRRASWQWQNMKSTCQGESSTQRRRRSGVIVLVDTYVVLLKIYINRAYREADWLCYSSTDYRHKSSAVHETLCG